MLLNRLAFQRSIALEFFIRWRATNCALILQSEGLGNDRFIKIGTNTRMHLNYSAIVVRS